MTEIDKFMKFFNRGLNGSPEYFQFSKDLEDYVVDHYDAIHAENPKFADYIGDNISDVTEPMEPGMDPTDFYRKLRKIVDTASQYLK